MLQFSSPTCACIFVLRQEVNAGSCAPSVHSCVSNKFIWACRRNFAVILTRLLIKALSGPASPPPRPKAAHPPWNSVGSLIWPGTTLSKQRLRRRWKGEFWWICFWVLLLEWINKRSFSVAGYPCLSCFHFKISSRKNESSQPLEMTWDKTWFMSEWRCPFKAEQRSFYCLLQKFYTPFSQSTDIKYYPEN